MSVVVRVTSVDNARSFTRPVSGSQTNVELPRDGRFVVLDEATGEVIAVAPRVVRGADGEDMLVFAADKDGEEILLILETAAQWPADTAALDVAMNDGLANDELAAARAIASQNAPELGDFARAGAAGASGFESLFDGISSTALIIGGLIAVGGITYLAVGNEDDEAPAQPTGLDLAPSSDADGDNIVNTGTGLLFTGSAEPEATLTVRANGTPVGTTIVDADGNFSISVDLPGGTNIVTVTATDRAGNISLASAPLSVVVDLIAPTAPAGLDLATADDSGSSTVDNITNLAQNLTISGTAEAGSQVELRNGTAVLGTVTAGTTGAFSLDVTLPDGVNAITAQARDAAGNISPASPALTITVDRTAPAAPTALDLAAADDTGASNSDNLTRNPSALTITGNAEAGSTVTLSAGTTVLATTVAGAGGTFSADVTLPSGTTAVTARATDVAGNMSAASAPLSITVDNLAPAAPAALDLASVDDTGTSSIDNVTDQEDGLTITGTAEAGSSVALFAGGMQLGTTTATAAGTFSIDLALPAGANVITAIATDQAGNSSPASASLTVTVGRGPQLLNATIDGDGDIVTLYFDELIDPDSAPAVSQFSFTGVMEAAGPVAFGLTSGMDSSTPSVIDLQITGTRVTLYLDRPVEAGTQVAYSAAEGTVTDLAGNAAPTLMPLAITNDLSITQSDAITLGRQGQLLLDGAEIVAFDPDSDRFFVTSSDGLQVIGVDANLNLTLLGVVSLGSNDIASVAVANGVVAVAVAAETRTDVGSVFLLDAGAAMVGPNMVINEVAVGAQPDFVTFTPDGGTILVANEGERTTLDDVEDGATLVDPEGSITIINIANGAPFTVQTAGFAGFNAQRDALIAEGLLTFSGTPGNEDITVAQDLEPEYIAVSPDGLFAAVTLQEANAIAILDIAAATIIDIQPLGIKPFENLNFDFSDRDDEINLGGFDARNVFGQFQPDSIASFVGADGEVYYVIANEGDARDDFFDDSDGRVDDLNLDTTVFPDADDLQDSDNLGRLEVTTQVGLNGDTDGDGDVDQILAFGGRSFSILNSQGVIVFDSGSHIEEFAASQGEFIGDDFPDTGVLDDGRSDAKGPEPEAITTGVFGDSVLAFVGLERGGGGVLVYDVTDPANVTFVSYLRAANTLAPEGLVYVPAEDSPTGRAILAVASEGDDPRGDDEGIGLSVFEIAPEGVYTLQLLHFADAEARSLAIDTAPNLAALVDAFEDDFANSITLAGGDNFIPGLFFTAQNDDSVEDALGFSGGPRVDIAIHNAIGVQASTIGNHEFDRGTATFASAIRASGEYDGALFPYLSANLDFSGDSALAPLFRESLGEGLQNVDALSNTIVPSAIIEENGELIGLVGATTQVLRSLTSAGGVQVDGTNANDIPLLAAQLQIYIDDLIAQGVNKIIVMSHLQQIALEEQLAPLLTGVDIILAAGSNTLLSDADDVLDTFDGRRPAVSQGDYPIVTAGADGAPTVIVNTDNEFTYLGRLVVDFDADGEIILASVTDNVATNGAYASTTANVAAAFGVGIDEVEEVAFADGTRGDAVRDLIAPVAEVLATQGSNVFGFSDVFLEGNRNPGVRTEETNLGNLTADANAFVAREALGLGDEAVVVSFKNGGGIRDSIGTLTGTGSDVVRGPNEGGVVTQLDVGAVLAFNNGLIVFDTTPQGLLNILNSPNVFQPNNGGFGQLSGLEVSYDPDLPQGSRVVDVALVTGEGDKIALVNDGMVVAGAPSTITMVTLDFIAGNDGDGTQIAENGSNFRYILDDGDGTYSLSAELGTLDLGGGNLVVNTGAFTGSNELGEQQALADFLGEFHSSLETAFDQEETPQSLDERIQNINVRMDTVLEDASGLDSVPLMPLGGSVTQDLSLVPVLAESFA